MDHTRFVKLAKDATPHIRLSVANLKLDLEKANSASVKHAQKKTSEIVATAAN